MELSFANGTDLQKSACRTVAHNLLNLPFDDIPLNVTVEFVSDPDPSNTENEFASTSYTYGDPSSTIKIASVAPNWPDPWTGVQFLQETFAHELGHAFFAALPQESRLTLARMFGAKSDDLSEINNTSIKWVNRVIEGIAETFKDAFLPQRYRRFANRTNRRISISEYPEFRRIFRNVPGERLRFDIPDGRNLYEIEGPDNEETGTVYNPQVSVISENNRAAHGQFIQVSGIFLPKGTVLRPRIRPFVKVPGLPGLFEGVRVRWSIADNKVGAEQHDLEMEWRNANSAQILKSAGNDEEFFSLEVLDPFPSTPFGIGMPEGPLRGINLHIPEDMTVGITTFLFSLIFPPDEDPFNDIYDDAVIAAMKSMTEGIEVSVEVPEGQVQPTGYNGGTRRSTSRIVGARL